MERRVLRFALALFLCASGVWAQTFSVKGVLRDPGGRTVDDGTFKMEFRLYEAETGGTKVWSEIQANVPVQHGVFSAELGVVQPLAGVSFLNPLFLGIAVEGHPEMAPRIKILPGPYSMAVLGVDNRFPSTGNVGIATTSPTEPLEVAGNLKLSNGGVLMFPDGTSLASADMGGTATSAASPGNLLLTADDDATGDGAVQLRTGSTTQVTVTGAGDVGIGTATPSSKLSVTGNADITGNLGVGTATPSNPLSVTGNADITGNLGIGTATPSSKLSVAGNADITGNLGVGTTTPSNPLSVTGNADIGGRLGIGTATPNENLAIAGMGATIELGAGVVGKEANAGKIGYRRFSDALDIVGAGASQETRRISLWAEGGTSIRGEVRIGDGTIPVAGTQLSVAPGTTVFDSPGTVGGGMTIDAMNRRVGIGTGGPAITLAIGDHDTGINWNGDGHLSIRTDGLERIRMQAGLLRVSNARIGVGTDNPRAPIDVPETGSVNIGQYGFLNNYTPAGVNSSGGNFSPSIITGGVIIAPEFQAISDARVKNVIGTSKGLQDLATLKQLTVTDYTYIDVVAKGTKPHKKLIAQQVQAVYPQAVNKGVDYVPSVYQMSSATALADGLLRITTEKSHGFAAADTVRLVFGEGYEDCVVRQVVDDHTFAVDHEKSVERVFVWGKKVHDFLTVDYEAIAMLNVSATQELARQMADLSARTEVLTHENEQLKAQVASLAAAETEKAALEARLTHMEDTVVRVTAVLQRLEEKNGAAGGQVLLEVPSATLAQSR